MRRVWAQHVCLRTPLCGVVYHLLYAFRRRGVGRHVGVAWLAGAKYKLYLECVSYDLRIEWKQGLEGNVKVKCHLKYDVRRPRGNILVCCSRILSNVDI